MGAPPGDRLESWKEIAAYLSRGVRTVRRWETEEGLPVHRHMHRALGSVYAFKSEIDRWQEGLRRRRTGSSRPASPHDTVKSIAVLPFANVSTDPSTEYFADGLTDEVIADLSKVKTLRLISRTSSMTFKGTKKDIKTIARELGVRYIVEGTVRRAGGRVRITARLIDAVTDDHLWADKYDGTIENVFEIQEQLARVIVEALSLRVTVDEDRRLSQRPIANVHAYDCYLQARQEAFRWRKDAIDHAVQLLQNGLTIVGENAMLYAALGRAYLQYREAGVDLGERPLHEAESCARRVSALDPDSVSGRLLRAWIYYATGHVQLSVRDLKLALEVEPYNPDTLALICNCYLISGKVSHARPLISRLLAVDPLTPLTRCMPGFADMAEGNLAAALEPYRQMFDMDRGNPMARLFYAGLLVMNRRGEEARAIATSFPPAVSGTVPARLTLFLVHALARDSGRALEVLTPEIEAVANATDVFPRFLAQGYALIGLTDRALHWLEIAVERGFINYPFLAHHDPSFENLRGDPRFERLMDRVRQAWEEFEP